MNLGVSAFRCIPTKDEERWRPQDGDALPGQMMGSKTWPRAQSPGFSTPSVSSLNESHIFQYQSISQSVNDHSESVNQSA